MTATTATAPSRRDLDAAFQAAIAKRKAEQPKAQREYHALVAKREELERRYQAEDRALGEQLVEKSAVADSLDRNVATAEAALRATADARIELLARQLFEFWDDARQHELASEAGRAQVPTLRARIERAREELEALALDPAADVDTNLRRILEATGIKPNDLGRAALRRGLAPIAGLTPAELQPSVRWG